MKRLYSSRSFFLTCGLLMVLLVTPGLWLWKARQQYALNRQLIAALVNDDTRQALTLVNAGASPNARSASPTPTLHLLIDRLLRRSRLPADDSPTALLLACGTDYGYTHTHCTDATKLVQTMLAHGGDIHALTTDKHSALEGAVSYNHLQVAELLLKNGANVNERYTEGRTPLMVATQEGFSNMVNLLLNYGADVNAADQEGQTALMEACLWEHEEIARTFLRNDADPNHKDQNGATALLLASGSHSLSLLQLLLDQGASVHVEANDWTPLREAVENQNVPMVELLLAHHADVGCRGDTRRRGDTLLNMTWTHERTPAKQQIRRLLRRAGAKEMYP